MAKLMNWNNFERQLKEKKLLLFSPLDITRLFGISKVAATFLVHRYVQKMFIRRVRRGLYVFPGLLPPDLYLANKIYEPSYVSLEFALSYHRVIPETVYEITSVTTKSTRCFTALGKIFSYHSLKQDAFTGYILEKQDGGARITIAGEDPIIKLDDINLSFLPILMEKLGGKIEVILTDNGRLSLILSLPYSIP